MQSKLTQAAGLVVCALAAGIQFQSVTSRQNPSSSNLGSPSDHVAAAVVQLLAVGTGPAGQNQECSATGFLVNDEGYVLTNAHVSRQLWNCLPKTPEAKIVAKFALSSAASGNSSQESEMAPAVSCELVGVDNIHDLAVMKTEQPAPLGGVQYGSSRSAGQPRPYAKLDAGDVRPGALVRVAGHPAFSWETAAESGHVLERRSLLLFGRNSPSSEVLILDLRLQRGSSGSPVYLNPDGAVVGVVEGQDPRNPAQTVAVPIRYAIELFDRLHVKWHAQSLSD